MAEISTLRDARRTYRFWVDDDIIDTFGAQLGPCGIAVYVDLCRHAKKGTALPSYATIANETGMSRRQAIYTIKNLENLKLLARETRHTIHGKHTSNSYTLLDLSFLRQDGSAPDAPNSIAQETTGAPDALTLVQDVHHSSAPSAPEGFSLKDTQIEGTHTPEEPEKPEEPQATPATCVCAPVKSTLQLFPIEEKDQSALRALVLTPDLELWAHTNGIHLDLARQFDHWMNDGVSNGRRKRDFVTAFKCWLQSPLRAQLGGGELSRFEQKKAVKNAGAKRFIEEHWHGREGQGPVSGESRDSSLHLSRPARRPGASHVLAGAGATLYARGI